MRVLFVEDNIKLGRATTRSLTRESFIVDHFPSSDDGWHAWNLTEYDVAVLDIMLEGGPLDGGSGLDLLRRARTAGFTTPVILLTALGSVDERVGGLEAGADDYLVKPFAIEELAARLRALGRRPQMLAATVIEFDDVNFDVSARKLVAPHGSALLSRGEGIVLERFLRAPDRLITKNQLGDSLHSLDQDFTENSIFVHVHRVRTKLFNLGSRVNIKTLRGLGYMAVSVSPIRAANNPS